MDKRRHATRREGGGSFGSVGRGGLEAAWLVAEAGDGSCHSACAGRAAAAAGREGGRRRQGDGSGGHRPRRPAAKCVVLS